jgi:hypothetical protein
MSLVRTLAVFLATIPAFSAPRAEPDVRTIIERSVAANEADWKAAIDYDYFEQDGRRGNSKTYDVRMILGSPYRRLVKVNGTPLPADEQKKEQQKMDEAIAQRSAESPSDRAKRVAQFEKDRQRDHLLMKQITQAFDFSFAGTKTVRGFSVYVLRATARKGYQPPNTEAEVLTGMQGELWIDRKTFQWVHVTAEVLRPVSIEGFLAKVEPGTYFELENMPVASGVWLPRHFAMKSHSRILSMINHKTEEEETYFGYRKAAAPGPVQREAK